MTRRLLLVFVVVAGFGLVGIPTAGAGTESTDELADRYGLVRQGDLPSGYELDSVRRESGGLAPYISVEGDCARINTKTTFRGGDPVTSRATFEEAVTSGRIGGQGVETVFTFDDTDAAKEYYRTFAPAFDDLVECRLMTDAVGNIGTYSALSVGKVGDQRTALTFEPRADRTTRLGLVRNDEQVVYLELYDDDATDAEFAALLKQAEKRSR